MAPFKVNNVFNLLIFQLNEYTVQFNLCSRHPCGYWMKVLDLPFTLSPSITFLSDLTFAISGFLSPSDNLPPQFNIKTYTISPLSFEKQNTITTPVTDLKPYFGNYLFSDYIIHLSHQHIPICSTIITKYSNYIQTLINSQFKENSTRELHLLSPFPFPIPPPHFLWFLKLFYNFDMRDCDDETWISIHHLSDYFLVHPSKIESALHASNPNLNQLIHHQIPIKKLLYCNPTTAQTLTLDSAHLLLDHFTIEELNDQSIFVVSLELVIKFPEDRTIANYLLTKFTHPRLYFLDNGQLESLLERLYLSILHNPNQQSPAHEVLKNLVKNYSFYHTSLPLLHKFIKHFLLAVGPLQAPSLILPPTWVPHFNFLNKLNTIKNLPNFHETDPIITIEVPPILSQHILNNHTLLDRYHLISSPSYLPSKSSTFFPQFVTFVMAIYIHLNLKLKQSTPSHLPMIDQYKALVPSVVHGFTLLEMKQLQMEQDMDSELLLLHL